VIRRNRTGVLVKRDDSANEYDLWAHHDERIDAVRDSDQADAGTGAEAAADAAAEAAADAQVDADAEVYADADADEFDRGPADFDDGAGDAEHLRPRRTWSKLQFALAALSATPVLFIGGLHAWPWQDAPAAANNAASNAVAAGHENDPVSLSLARLGINASLDALTTDSVTGIPQVPALGHAGWISSGVKPGELGRAVILGRRSQSGEDVFAKLVNARAGDKIVVTTAAGKTLTFVIQSVEQFTTGRLPESRIDGGGKKQAQLRLITSTGTYDQSKGGFPRNVVVFADLAR